MIEAIVTAALPGVKADSGKPKRFFRFIALANDRKGAPRANPNDCAFTNRRGPPYTEGTMQARELRQKYLEFFESKGALRLASDSLVTDDPTLLFTVAGMV